MFLNDPVKIKQQDVHNMLGTIGSLPDDLRSAWNQSQTLDVPAWKGIEHVVVCGVDDSVLGGELVSKYAALRADIPVSIHRDYNFPAWGHNPQTLAIATGDSEVSLSSAKTALENRCRLLGISNGSALAQLASSEGFPCWEIPNRNVICFSFGMILGLLSKLGMISDTHPEMDETFSTMQKQKESLLVDIPLSNNPAKRLAGQMMGRWVTIFAAGHLSPVAKRWKTQINKLSKAPANVETIPDADYNTLAGTHISEDILTRTINIFLTAPSNHHRDNLRCDLTRKALMLEGLGTDGYRSHGDSSLSHMWTALQFGDYTACYLALSYGMDPSKLDAIQDLENSLRSFE